MSAAPLDERGLPAGYPFRPELEITPRDALASMRDPDAPLLLVDVRTAQEVACASVAGALHIPLDELASRAGEIEAAMGDDDRPVAFLCHHGVRSLKAALFMRQRGVEEAMSVAGGIDLWSAAADPSVPRY